MALHDRPPPEVRILVESEFLTTISRSTEPRFERGWSKGSDQFGGRARHKPTASGALSLILSWNKDKSKIDANYLL
jgi:hypothetical protein